MEHLEQNQPGRSPDVPASNLLARKDVSILPLLECLGQGQVVQYFPKHIVRTEQRVQTLFPTRPTTELLQAL